MVGCKKRCMILIFAVAFAIAGGLAGGDAMSLWTDELFTGNTGNPFTDWYEVADWETKVCMDWGGDKDPNEVFTDTMVGEVFHNLVVTLQAQARDPLPEEFGEYSGEEFFEVSWFIQPTESENDINYEVYLSGPYLAKKVIGSGNANYVNGFRDYYVEFSSTNYTEATLKYWNENIEVREFKVPIVR